MFGFHDIEITERTFVGTEKIYENIGVITTSDILYRFYIKGECFRCGKHFKGKQKMRWFDVQQQPYDTNFGELE